MWLILATSSARTLTQFSLLTEALALAALFSPSRAGAVGVGLSLMKPQIGGAALVWMLLARQWTRAAIAASVPLGLILIFAWHAHANPRALLVQYAHVVASVHGGANPIAGHTELRSWLPAIWPDHGHTQAIATAALAIVLMLPAIVFAARVRTWTPVDRLEMLALCGAVSLLVVRHLSYDFILLWPAIAGAPAAFALLAGALVADLPAWARLAAARGAPALGFLTEIDRVIAVVAWAVLSWRRLARSGGGTIAEGQDLE
jgi:hypothetical protein